MTGQARLRLGRDFCLFEVVCNETVNGPKARDSSPDDDSFCKPVHTTVFLAFADQFAQVRRGCHGANTEVILPAVPEDPSTSNSVSYTTLSGIQSSTSLPSMMPQPVSVSTCRHIRHAKSRLEG